MDLQLDVNTTYRFQNMWFSVSICMFWPSVRERQKDVKILRSEQQ